MRADEFVFHPAAEAEFEAAAQWYEDREPGLGAEFVEAVRQKINDILEQPQRWRMVRGCRRALLGRFPYAVVYRESDTRDVQIIAIAHFRRRPTYWAGR